MNPTTLLAAWLLNAILAWGPLSAHRYTGVTDDETYNRYQSIAYDMATVTMDPEELPVFHGAKGRAQTALLALSIASFESNGFRSDVDTAEFSGDCRDEHGHSLGTPGSPTCKGGTFHAKCLAQIWPRRGERTITNRQDCFRVELSRIRESFGACRSLPFDQRLAVYASGTCEYGHRESEHRVQRATRYWAAHEFLLGVD
jgi:hypothetical protein